MPPGTIPGKIRRPTIETQTHIAHAEIKLKWFHLGQPWFCGIGLFVLGAFFHYWFRGIGTAVLVACCGLAITVFDFRLRMSRIFWEARVIGPVTILSCTTWLTCLILLGWSKTLFLAWLMGWILTSIVWNIWMLGGEHKDENRQFPIAAANAGLGGVRFTNLRRRSRGGDDDDDPGGGFRQPRPGIRLLPRRNKLPKRGFQPAEDGWAAASAGQGPHAGGPGSGLIGTMELPPGEYTAANAGARIENLEGAHGHPPGSWSLAPDQRNAAKMTVLITDPESLDLKPLPWPYGMRGSRPDASIAEPVVLGLWQDGTLVEYVMLRHHLQIVGLTDSGKTMTTAYNLIGEGITRRDYACIAFDIGKGEQFLGPMRPALHALATEPDELFAYMDSIERIRVARRTYLGKNHLTEWTPGCGLMFLDFWLEEAADIADLLVNRAFGGTKEKMEQWKANVRLWRSLGGRWDMSTARSDFQELPTMVRSQANKMCFGVNSAAEAQLGLTDEQLKRGARPQMWKTDVPGKFYIHAPSIPNGKIAMPARGWYWGSNSEMMAVFAEQHPSGERPFDDVTGEAWEAVPGPAATSAFAVTPAMTGGFTPTVLAGDGQAAPGPAAGEPASGARPPLFAVPPEGFRPLKLTKAQTLDITKAELARMRREWTSTRPQVLERRAFKHLAAQMDRTEQQVSNLLTELALDPANLLHKDTSGKRAKWTILPNPSQQKGNAQS
jgi:hypothetical protein